MCVWWIYICVCIYTHTLHYMTWHYITLHYIIYITLHYTTLHYATRHNTTRPNTTWHTYQPYHAIPYPTLPYITLHFIHTLLHTPIITFIYLDISWYIIYLYSFKPTLLFPSTTITSAPSGANRSDPPSAWRFGWHLPRCWRHSPWLQPKAERKRRSP